MKIRTQADIEKLEQVPVTERIRHVSVADLLRDTAILEEARREAQGIIAEDADLRSPAHRGLREALLTRWRGKLDLASVG